MTNLAESGDLAGVDRRFSGHGPIEKSPNWKREAGKDTAASEAVAFVKYETIVRGCELLNRSRCRIHDPDQEYAAQGIK